MRINQVIDEDTYIDDEVIEILLKKGYKRVGSGMDQMAFLEPGTKKILKIFGTDEQKRIKSFSTEQRMFFKWAKFCMANPNNKFLVKFDGYESFNFNGCNYLQIRQERLTVNYKVTELVAALTWMVEVGRYKNKFEEFKSQTSQMDYEGDALARLIKIYGELEIKSLLDTINEVCKIGQRNGYDLDLHSANFMMRGKTIVILDPWVI